MKLRTKIILLVVILFALITGFVMVIMGIVFGGVFYGSKSTYEYKCAIAEVKKNDKAKSALGEPLEEGTFIVPNIKIEGSRRFVDFSTSLTGPKGSGTLYVNSIRDGFRSDFKMTLEQDGERTLLYEGSYPCSE